MTVKRFLVQIESAPDTRWIQSDEDVIGLLRIFCKNAVGVATTGTIPRVTVVIEETRLEKAE